MRTIIIVFLLLGLTGCTLSKSAQEEAIRKTLEENPDILINILKKHEVQVATIAESGFIKKAEEQKTQQQLAQLQNPLKPQIDTNRPVLGPKNGPMTIVAYSDFLCPYCAVGAKNVREIFARHKDTLRLVHKHYIVKPQARLAAMYYEAIGMQDHHLAWVFHDMMFDNQERLLKEGEPFIVSVAKQLGIDMNKLAKDVQSEKVAKYLLNDMKEVEQFRLRGTPMYVVNGVLVEGASQVNEFQKIIMMTNPMKIQP